MAKNYIPGTGGFMKPQEMLGNIDIKKGMCVADFGCGAGYFTIPMAQKVGKEGKVFAIDVREGALESVRGRAASALISNIETVRGNLEKEGGSRVGVGSCDIVVLANILFQSNRKDDILKEAKRVLKKTGKAAIIEWRDGTSLGPGEGYRISKENLKDLAKSAGFVLEKEFNAGDSHYGLVFSL